MRRINRILMIFICAVYIILFAYIGLLQARSSPIHNYNNADNCNITFLNSDLKNENATNLSLTESSEYTASTDHMIKPDKQFK
jgi:hypothetical protein